MRKNYKLTLLSALAAALLATGIQSCKKANTAPVVNWLTPTDTTVVTLPDSIAMQGTVSDEGDLHELAIYMVREQTDTVLYQDIYVHGLKAYSYRANFFPDSTQTGVYMLYVSAQDHEGGNTLFTRSFTVQP